MRCKVCGKRLTSADEISAGVSRKCSKLLGVNLKELREKKTLSEDELKFYVPCVKVFEKATELGIPHSVLLRVMGGNRGIGKPMLGFSPRYYKGKRYLPVESLRLLPSLKRLPAPKKGRPKKH